VIPAWSRFRALNRDDRLLALEAAIVLVLVWAGLRTLRFRVLRHLLNRYAGRADARFDRTRPALNRIGWAVIVAADHLPTSMTCLVQALAADAMLRRRGFASELRLGVRLHRSGSDSLEAHAWVECDDGIVVGGLKDLTDYAVLRALGGL
jgi:hypothetical protein